MDRPKREEIAYILLAYDKDVKLFMSGGCTEHPSITESIDQVLALFPNIEADKNIIVELADKQVKGWIEEAKQKGYTSGYEQAVKELRATTIDDPGPWGS